MKLKKSPLTLIEVMIAMVLTGLLLSSLFTYYFRSSKMRIEIERAKTAVLQRQFAQQRLFTVCSQLVDTSPVVTRGNDTLIFQFDNGIDFDPKFTGELQGKLFLNRNNELIFQMENKKGRQRDQILATGIRKISTQFFDELERKWVPSWPEDLERAPAMIKITTEEEGTQKSIAYAFFLPIEKESLITYREMR